MKSKLSATLLVVGTAFGVFLLNSGISGAQLADSPWPTFHGNSQRTGLSPYDTSHVDGTIKWIYEADWSIQSSPAIGEDGTIYVGIDDGYLYAFNPDGTVKWKSLVSLRLIRMVRKSGKVSRLQIA